MGGSKPLTLPLRGNKIPVMAKKKDKSREGPWAPEWATQPFRDFIEQTKRLDELLRLSISGISILRGMPKIVEVLAKMQGESGKETRDTLQRAKKEAELAKREVKDDFPLLHAQTTIALWSALEATIRYFLTRWLQNYEKAMEVEAIQKLRVKIGEYESLEGEERFFYILNRLEQELATPLKTGVTRFESLLDPFGLAGPVDEDVRRNLFELNQVRNALVHRAGLADRRLTNSCPWMKLKVGDPVKVDREMTTRYSESVANYALELIIRIGEHFGVDMSEFRSKSQATNGGIKV